ncbi:MAG: hypothetical protein DHS20C18_38340 [Saprospiraceae bacterium]|nr:MAG: hypothetical protein DHS20C18_38340 [Saprospiraceae bacterium]
MNIKTTPKKALIFLLSIISVLLAANIAVVILKFEVGHEGGLLLIEKLFDFNYEKSIPTLFSVLILFCTSLILFLISISEYKRGGSSLYWYGLSFIFLFLTMDEFLEIHENIGEFIQSHIEHHGIFFFAWVIPYGLLFIAFSFFYLRFLLQLPRRAMWLFIISGAIYVVGALGFESLGGWYIEVHGEENVLYAIIYTLEELFEILGISLFIYTLLSYAVDEFLVLDLKIEKEVPVGN